VFLEDSLEIIIREPLFLVMNKMIILKRDKERKTDREREREQSETQHNTARPTDTPLSKD
jgi:hypothetical protein